MLFCSPVALEFLNNADLIYASSSCIPKRTHSSNAMKIRVSFICMSVVEVNSMLAPAARFGFMELIREFHSR